MTLLSAAPAVLPAHPDRIPPLPNGVNLRAVAGELIRDLIRRDSALWVRVQADPALRREFGFDDEHTPA